MFTTALLGFLSALLTSLVTWSLVPPDRISPANRFIAADRFAPAFAQVPAKSVSKPGRNKTYTRKTVFLLPIKIDDHLRPDLREIYLYVKDGSGPWIRKDAVPPTQPHFTFRAPHDGEYWFSVMTLDKYGNRVPADVAKEEPQLIVVVDSRP